MIKKLFLFFILFFFFFCGICYSENLNTTFWEGIVQVSSFNKPFWADMHSSIIRAEIAYAANSPDYDWGEYGNSHRPFIFANLGADIPVWSGDFSGGKYGLSFTLPFILDTWYDRFEPLTSPIINISYRFGAFDIGFINRFDSPKKLLPFTIHNYSVKLSLFKHESTHLGDELTVKRQDLNFPIKRIDVLMNYAELIFTLNDPDNQPRQNHGFRFGILFNYNFKEGWYTVIESEANEDYVEKSTFPFELYLQYQYQSPLFSKGFQVIASVEYRLRERYKYPYYESGASNAPVMKNPDIDLVNCFNVFAGVRFDNQKRNYFSKIGIGLRGYYGLNPHGQFRSMPEYSQWGIAVLFE